MSAYALPGLFPPIDSLTIGCSSIDAEEEKKKEQSESSESCSTSTSNDSNNQQTHQSNNMNTNTNMPLHHHYNPNSSSSSSSNIGCLLLNSAGIAVKEAKIDPVRWIQYVTGGGQIRINNTANQIGKTLRRRVWDSSTTTSTSGFGDNYINSNNNNNNSINSNTNSNSSSNSKSKNKNKSPQNEAIEFELSISFNGRKYTAKRTMQCIMQLRDDLIREMKHRRQWLTQEGRELSSSPSPPTTSLHLHRYDSSGNGNIDSSFFDPKTSISNIIVVQIPEIPPLTGHHHHGDEDRGGDDNDTHGFVGRGFTMLHAMVTSYVPVMERWLKNVMVIVPPQDSECLLNFLWEPQDSEKDFNLPTCFKSVLDSINNNNNNNNDDDDDDINNISSSNHHHHHYHHLNSNTIKNHNSVSVKKFKSCTSLATLGSIKELDYNTEEDTDSDSEEDDDHHTYNSL